MTRVRCVVRLRAAYVGSIAERAYSVLHAFFSGVFYIARFVNHVRDSGFRYAGLFSDVLHCYAFHQGLVLCVTRCATDSLNGIR